MSEAVEKHFTVAQVAEMWGLSPGVVITLFRDEPDVLKIRIGRVMGRAKKIRESLRIPESALIRVHKHWSRTSAERKPGRGGVQ